MKALLVLFFVGSGFIADASGSLNYEQNTKNEIAVITPTPAATPTKVADGCVEANFKPRSEADIAAMTPRQLIDAEVTSELQRNSFDSFFAWADYQTLIGKYIRRSGAEMLPVMTEYMDAYDPIKGSKCERIRFSVAAREANDLDRFRFRLRGSKEGLLTIAALEHAIERMAKAGFDDKKRDYDNNRVFRLHGLFLEEMKGVNEVDHAARDTFWVNRKIKMSDEELLEFSNFLISRDPTYPAWSGTDRIKDFSRINEAGSPAQVRVFKNPERFYEAYLEFKKSKDAAKIKN